MALNAQRPPDHIPVDYSKVGVDIETLYQASKKKEEVCYFILFINYSNSCFSGSIFRNLNQSVKSIYRRCVSTSIPSLFFVEEFYRTSLNRVTGFATKYKSLSRVIKKTLFVSFLFCFCLYIF